MDQITAKTLGTPAGGLFGNPWPPDFPAAGQRVAIFAYEVTGVDGTGHNIRTYHVGPAETAAQGPIGSSRDEPQGGTVAWRGCGTGTVTSVSAPPGRERTCEVAPDEASLL
ncbi:hypothetical protein G3I59_09650 [Amycolatopsis rubida]|uniref:Uncharacterized protein n=1 Tax=Amycolatopsis rubida TaxID=112413 RepID=A0ABX0BSQ6_9PSEU|nr:MULTISPECIES: hypothetical protein [Amycolatopsis]MYW90858.1 hypothetical protein [Amycolatopsis rubida]NEC55843.1 hypothetical protein [Amycolatopsis rubida]OAP26077.1 hypothetical protein A4R44_03454 [Amycolatopsis sp. M39]